MLGSGDPLYIVDGVIINNDSPELIDLGGGAQNRLVDLNPNDIERIEVVKGAAAAALYGSRANNGVVQIFTKRGQTGAPRVTFTTTARTDAVRKTLPVNTYPFSGPESDTARVAVERFDFQDKIFQRAYGTEQYLSVLGGSQGTRYAVSGAHYVNGGVVEGNQFRRLNGRARLDQTLADWASLSAGAQYIQSRSQDVPNGGLNSNYGALTGFIFGPNTYDPRPDKDGFYPSSGILANPLEVIDRYDFNQTTGRFIGDAQLNLTPLSGFSVDYTLGYDTYTQTAIAFIPRGTSAPGLGGGQSRRSERISRQLNNDLNLRYRTDVRPGLQSTTLVGGTIQYEDVSTLSAQSQTLTPGSIVVGSGTTDLDFGEFRSELVIYGAFAQQTFGLADRLFLTAAGRVDASSAFGEGERWQFYPKLSASYVISDERFWQTSALGRAVPALKLRASYGESGGLTALGAFSRFTNYAPEGYAGNPGLLPSSQLGALDVKPERQREYELGVDVGLLDERLGIEFTYYNQQVSDLLLDRSLAPTTGYLNRLENVGTLDNVGAELLVRALAVDRPGLSWETTFTYATNQSEVNGLEENVLILGGFGFVGAINGEPLGVFYTQYFARDDDGNLILNPNGLPQQELGVINPETGLGESRRGDDGQPTGDVIRKVTGDPNPDFTASWINEFQLGRRLTLRAQLEAAYGFDVFNFTRRLAALSAFGTLEDYQRELEGELPAGYNAAVFNIFENWIEDGSFVKLRELALSYTFFGEDFGAGGLGFRSARVSFIGRNLLSIDSYSGYDPEINVGGQSNTVRGFDFVEVPIPRTFTLGVTFEF